MHVIVVGVGDSDAVIARAATVFAIQIFLTRNRSNSE